MLWPAFPSCGSRMDHPIGCLLCNWLSYFGVWLIVCTRQTGRHPKIWRRGCKVEVTTRPRSCKGWRYCRVSSTVYTTGRIFFYPCLFDATGGADIHSGWMGFALQKKKKKSKLQHVKSWIAPPKVLIWHSIASHFPTDLWYMWREPPILCPRAFSFAAQLCYKLWVGTPLDGGVLPCIPYFVMFCPVFLSAIQLEKRDFKRHWTQWKVVSSKTHQSGRTNHNNT